MLWNGNEWEKVKAMRISRQLFPVKCMAIWECGILQLFG